MNIKPIVYESLTPHQRVIATIEAVARGDETEKNRLVKTCPKKTYRGNDSAYVEKVEALEHLALVVECDMRRAALNLFAQGYSDRDPQNPAPRPSLYTELLNHPDFLGEICCIDEAWNSILQEEGIDPLIMDRMMLGLKHDLLKFALCIAEDLTTPPDPELTKAYKKMLRGYLDRVDAD